MDNLTNIQLEKILLFDRKTKLIFKGVFSRDKIEPCKIYPSCIIINTDSSTEVGTHWLAIFFNNDKTAIFFDSFGRHPKNFGLCSYLNSNSVSWTWNKKNIQSKWSSFCGYYCVTFLLFLSRGISLNEFVSFFNKDQLKNDNLVKKMIIQNL